MQVAAVVVENLGLGLAAGAVACGVLVLVAGAARRLGRMGVVPFAGVAVVVTSAVALGRAETGVALGTRLWIGVTLLVIGPFAVGAFPTTARRSLGRGAAAIPGAVLVAWSTAGHNEAGWVPPVVFVSVVLGGALVEDFDRAHSTAGLGPLLLAVSALGAFATLPDTEEIAVVLGVVLVLAVLGWPVVLASLGPGAYAVVGLLVWLAAVGGRGRPGAVVGAVACLGLMIVEPLVRRLGARRERARASDGWPTWFVVALDLVVVGVVSRVAGLETSAVRAAAIALLTLAGGGGVLLALPHLRGTRSG